MQYKPRLDEEKDLVGLSNAESELQSQLDTDALRPVPNDVPQPISRPEKAKASSGPGSEYWLP